MGALLRNQSGLVDTIIVLRCTHPHYASDCDCISPRLLFESEKINTAFSFYHMLKHSSPLQPVNVGQNYSGLIHKLNLRNFAYGPKMQSNSLYTLSNKPVKVFNSIVICIMPKGILRAFSHSQI